ncbi:TetR family transcriptional regulator [Rhodospirillum rubrum]|uniref:TetR/AcrR family transcriptional regulator n=1 Tax=Rhodospirillum rubrum TaxID=1085 RepID=UPI001906AEDD|nr:TetR/AcrR family transcriptional regulator [Rhodospirillum rubrum]MBK1665493.1 TetR family transcriptional regulator [Rhodospirillum rubrum]MBK1678101.1 TetR family transcriptional regulator [Rhodospirillum rubrum]
MSSSRPSPQPPSATDSRPAKEPWSPPAADRRGKRAAILAAARKLFLGEDYASVSVESIAAEAGVSKATVYAHFAGKADLFAEVIRDRTSSVFDLDETILAGAPAERLRVLGLRLLAMISCPDSLAVHRRVMGDGERFPEIREIFFRSGPAIGHRAVACHLSGMNEKGQLRVPDPELAAELFLGMLKGSAHMRMCLGISEETEDERVRRVDEVVRIMMAAYAP